MRYLYLFPFGQFQALDPVGRDDDDVYVYRKTRRARRELRIFLKTKKIQARIIIRAEVIDRNKVPWHCSINE